MGQKAMSRLYSITIRHATIALTSNTTSAAAAVAAINMTTTYAKRRNTRLLNIYKAHFYGT
jgi:hypothetical protein